MTTFSKSIHYQVCVFVSVYMLLCYWTQLCGRCLNMPQTTFILFLGCHHFNLINVLPQRKPPVWLTLALLSPLCTKSVCTNTLLFDSFTLIGLIFAFHMSLGLLNNVVNSWADILCNTNMKTFKREGKK